MELKIRSYIILETNFFYLFCLFVIGDEGELPIKRTRPLIFWSVTGRKKKIIIIAFTTVS